MTTWKLEDAKNRFSELVRRALAHKPQRVTRNGRDAVVIVSAEDYEKLAVPQDLVEFMRSSPLASVLAEGGLVLKRDRDMGRNIAF